MGHLNICQSSQTMNLSNSFLHLLPRSEQDTALVLCGLTTREPHSDSKARPVLVKRDAFSWMPAETTHQRSPHDLNENDRSKRHTLTHSETHDTHQGETQKGRGRYGGRILFRWQVHFLCGQTDFNLRPPRPPGSSWIGQMSS